MAQVGFEPTHLSVQAFEASASPSSAIEPSLLEMEDSNPRCQSQILVPKSLGQSPVEFSTSDKTQTCTPEGTTSLVLRVYLFHHRGIFVVWVIGLEPTTSASQMPNSNQLNYTHKKHVALSSFNGASRPLQERLQL